MSQDATSAHLIGSRTDLTPHNITQVKKKLEDADQSFGLRLAEAWRWLLVPDQVDPNDTAITWESVTMPGASAGRIDPLAERAGNKLKQNGQIYAEMGGSILKLHLDRVLMQDKNHLCVRTLADWFAQYHYLPRLTNQQVLADSVRDGVGLLTWTTDSFAYADRYDEEKDRYVGLVAGTPNAHVRLDGNSVLVKPDVAKKQLDAEQAAADSSTTATSSGSDGQNEVDSGITGNVTGSTEAVVTATLPTHFNARVHLASMRPLPDAQKIIENVVQHLAGTQGAEVELSLSISANHKDGFNDSVKRTVLENCRTLKFDHSEFHNG